MNLIVRTTGKLNGTVMPPSSKSQSVRALLLATMAKGTSVLKNVLVADDTLAAKEVCQKLGAVISVLRSANGSEDLEIKSLGAPFLTSVVDLYTHNSGITTRFVLPMLGLRNETKTITLECGEQMRRRPMQSLVNALQALGMKVDSVHNDGTCPLSVAGKLMGGKAEVEGITSQYISALLLSLPLAERDSEIVVANLQERPYVEMTTQWLDDQNINYTWDRQGNLDIFRVAGRQKYQPFSKIIPGDFSSASYLVAAGVLFPGRVIIKGLSMDDPQGDKRLVSILLEMGADILIKEEELVIVGGKELRGKVIDCNGIPDLLPTLAVVGTFAQGKTSLINVPQARIKETDRIASMAEGLAKMGAKVEEEKDGLIIYQSKLKGGVVRGFDDHRTVMALALAGMLAEGETVIDAAEAINKTFPTYVEVMRGVGGRMRMN